MGSSICVAGGLTLILLGHLGDQVWFFIIGFALLMVGLPAGNAVTATLLAEVVHPVQRGVASGISGALSLLGNALGFATFVVGLSDVVLLIGGVGLTALMAITNFLWTPDGPGAKLVIQPSVEMLLGRNSHRRHGMCGPYIRAFAFSPKRHIDFALILCSRLLYAACSACVCVYVYLFEDLAGYTPAGAMQFLGITSLASLGAGFAVTMPAARLGDKYGRMVPILIGMGLSSVALLQIFICSIQWLCILGAVIFGMGMGGFASCEVAIAVDAVPTRRRAAHFMSLFAFFSLTGATLGQSLSSNLLEWVNRLVPHAASSVAPNQKYCWAAYFVVLCVASFNGLLAFALMCLVRPARAKRMQAECEASEPASVSASERVALIHASPHERRQAPFGQAPEEDDESVERASAPPTGSRVVSPEPGVQRVVSSSEAAAVAAAAAAAGTAAATVGPPGSPLQV